MKYRSYTLLFKTAVLKYRETHNVTQTAAAYHLDRKLVRNWSVQKERIFSQSLKADRRRLVNPNMRK